MERRGSIPSVEKVQLLARYLGVTTSELLGETSQAPAIPLRDSAMRGEALRLSVPEVEIALAYRRADERARSMVELALKPFREEKRTTNAC